MSAIADVRSGDIRIASRSRLAPYLVGVGLGVLSWIAFAIAHDPLGITTALSRVGQPVAALAIGADAAAQNSYWRPMPFSWDYGVLFLVGTIAGSFVCALWLGRVRLEVLPRFWRERFGPSVVKRLATAFASGAPLMYGARLAGGCTSGHGLSGGLQKMRRRDQ